MVFFCKCSQPTIYLSQFHQHPSTPMKPIFLTTFLPPILPIIPMSFLPQHIQHHAHLITFHFPPYPSPPSSLSSSFISTKAHNHTHFHILYPHQTHNHTYRPSLISNTMSTTINWSLSYIPTRLVTLTAPRQSAHGFLSISFIYTIALSPKK